MRTLPSRFSAAKRRHRKLAGWSRIYVAASRLEGVNWRFISSGWRPRLHYSAALRLSLRPATTQHTSAFRGTSLPERIHAMAGGNQLALLGQCFPNGARILIRRRDGGDGRALAGTHRPASDPRGVVEPRELEPLAKGFEGRFEDF